MNMNEELPCKCGHPAYEHHDDPFGSQCWHVKRDRYGIPVCPCLNFEEMSNLEYLEFKYDQKSLSL
jgi:hypothetical protein